MINSELPCDGCGRLASPDHIARRLQRLEWATRFRPIHINILLLGAVAPTEDSDLIYSLAGDWRGEAKTLLTSLGVTTEGKSPNAVLAEFQRGGFFLTHVLECPLDPSRGENMQHLIAQRLPAVSARIRRSLKPKTLVPVSQYLQQFLTTLNPGELRCAVLLDAGKPFGLDADVPGEAANRLRQAISAQNSHASAV